MTDGSIATTESGSAWTTAWLTPARCRLLLIVILGLGFLGHLRYLTHNCPIDLSGDEAQYWDWSRQLDLSYYSKGPLVAYIIRASCSIFGDTMPAVRVPALVLAVGTSLLTYWLTLRLFASDRVALGAVLLNHLVPMFVAGSVMMTIDPPAFFCWGLACCCLAEVVTRGRRWGWIGIGLALGVGFLAKYVVFLWLLGLAAWLVVDRDSRRWLRTPWPYVMLLIAAAFTTPVIVWNSQHDWVSLRHVARQTGSTSESKFDINNVLEFVGGQLAAVGPMLWVILVGAVVAIRHATERRREQILLACLSLPYFLLVFVWSVRAKIQVNWPAPAYFAWMVLAAWFLGTRLQSKMLWKRWRGWFWGAVIFGIAFMPIAHNTEILYPVLARFHIKPKNWDPTYKLRGWAQLGQVVSDELKTLKPGSFVMGEKYDFTSELAFYVHGNPRPEALYVGSWFANPKRRARYSQYDMWANHRLDRPSLIGKDAIFFGYDPHDAEGTGKDLVDAFDSFAKLRDVEIYRRGVHVRTYHLFVGRGFKGMKHPDGEGKN